MSAKMPSVRESIDDLDALENKSTFDKTFDKTVAFGGDTHGDNTLVHGAQIFYRHDDSIVPDRLLHDAGNLSDTAIQPHYTSPITGSRSDTDLTQLAQGRLGPDSGLKADVKWRKQSADFRKGNPFTLDVSDHKKRRHSGLTLLSHQAPPSAPRWNLFRSVPSDKDTENPKWMNLMAQAFKIFAYIAMHMIVMGSGFISKMLMLLMAANLRSQVEFVPCKPYGNGGSFVPQDKMRLPEGYANWFLWGLYIALNIPELLTVLRCLRIICFKFEQAPNVYTLLGALFFETLRSLGVSILVFVVLPSIDSVRGAMLMCAMATVPAALSALSHVGPRQTFSLAIFDFVAFTLQFTGLWLWPGLDGSIEHPWLLSFALLLTSVGWWENYVSKSAKLRFIAYLGGMKDRLHRSRYKTYLVVSVWKMCVSLFVAFLAGGSYHNVLGIFHLPSPHSNTTVQYDEGTASDVDRQIIEQMSHSTMLIWIWMILAAYICYETAKYACKVKMERFSYAIPVISVIPAVIVVLVSLCETKKETPCFFASWLVPDTTFWNCEYGTLYDGLIVNHMGWAWILWFTSYLWIVSHVFLQKPGRLSKTDTLFITPMYDGLLVDQTLTLNRRRLHVSKVRTANLQDVEWADDMSMVSQQTDLSLMYSMTSLSLANSNLDSITKIYICATMWHETKNEMLQMIKSILRMDEDQCARKNAQKYLKVVDPDYYELEAHIFFDDAWEDSSVLGCRIPNEYVQQLISVVDEAASAVHKVWMHLKPPVKIDTQYGGRLVWTLPGDNRLFVHMKDKTKIRHKKRWSQVMYMYYLLGFRIMELIPDVARKQVLADNTFLLTIDGDSNFHPSSVQKLVDLMKKHSRIGSACGRIHPIGSGIMVWYQKFEYAIAHWLQKAAEHVFGCVLCSPGCFSLFRGSALMDDNVMNKYTKLAEEPRHFVQYDQGEDRWLSTLLLKQGYRIEYAAAADADTYAPEGFSELFNQRRRWTPSSIANTVDLLADYKKACKNNDSISRLYILYQMLVILFSLMGPAIIFTMMIFAQVAAFHIPSRTILWANLAPVLMYILTCFIASSKAQLALAKFMSVGYAFIMMAVLVGTGIQITAEGFGSPTTIFICAMACLFCGAAFLHPLELPNIFYGFAFFLMIPCTYVLMSLYSLINLNVINWGTREAAQKAVGGDDTLTPLERMMKRFRGLSMKKEGDENLQDAGAANCNCANLCQCLLCPGAETPAKRAEEDRMRWLDGRLHTIDDNVHRLTDKIDSKYNLNLHRSIARTNTEPMTSKEDAVAPFITLTQPSPVKHGDSANVSKTSTRSSSAMVTAMEFQDTDGFRYSATPVGKRVLPQTRALRRSTSLSSITSDTSLNLLQQPDSELRKRSASVSVSMNVPSWMKHESLYHAPYDILDELESQFWTELIQTYLQPLKTEKTVELLKARALLDLRNMIAFALLLLNGLLVLIIYLLQINANILSIEFEPFSNYTWNKWDPNTGSYEVVNEPLKIEPIGFTIIMFLSVILVVQTFGMILHRLHTVSHILASTVLPCFKRRRNSDIDGEQLLEENAVEIARRMQQLSDPEGEGNRNNFAVKGHGRRKRIVFDLEKGTREKGKTKGLNAAFKKRFMNFNPQTNKTSLRGLQLDKGGSFFDSAVAQQKAAEAIKQRRDSLVAHSPEQQEEVPKFEQKPTGLLSKKLSLAYQRRKERNSADKTASSADQSKPSLLSEIEKMMTAKNTSADSAKNTSAELMKQITQESTSTAL